MFIRIREIKSDGRRPEGVEAKILCAGRCERRRDERCPMKPRCRWRIGAEAGLELMPRRLQVAIAENRRVEGRVTQEHIATLGAIEAHLLPGFWAAFAPEMVAKIKHPSWPEESVAARVAFWETAKPRLDRLSNRLDVKAMRLIVHARIPWPKEAEREWAAADGERRRSYRGYEQAKEMIEVNERIMARAQEQNSELRKLALYEVTAATEAGKRLEQLTKKN